MKKQRVVAVTVTFNRFNTLQKTIESLLSQSYEIERIIVVDNNSSPENKFRLNECAIKSDKIDIVWLDSNSGGAGGFEAGMNYAKNKYNPDWYWIMDDDAYPREKTLEILLSYQHLDNVGCLAPIIYGIDKQKYQLYHHKSIKRFYTYDQAKYHSYDEIPEVSEIDADAFVGPLFPRHVISELGVANGGLFIYGDDTEYTTRVHCNYKIYLIKNAIIDHNDPPTMQSVLNPKAWWKEYYEIRNRILLTKKYNNAFGKMASAILLSLNVIRRLMAASLKKDYQQFRFVRIKLLCKAYRDGMNNIEGKVIDPVEYSRFIESYIKEKKI